MIRSGAIVDCAEGTTRQFALQPHWAQPHLRIGRVSTIFITHMHADHVMGLVPLLRNLLRPPPLPNATHQHPKKTIDIYGPAGLRTYVRQIMKMTLTATADTYSVHELLRAHDTVTPCLPPDSNVAALDHMHLSEIPGRDISPSDAGLWHNVTQARGRTSNILVSAGPILHRDPCIGYVFEESQSARRKLVILGDTYDPEPMIDLCHAPALLVHEATDSHISHDADPTGKLAKRLNHDIKANALARGHSIPEMAGAFAHKIGAKMLVLNHLSPRFPAPRHPKDAARHRIIQNIAQNAASASHLPCTGKDRKVIVAYDYLRISVPVDPPPSSHSRHISDANDHERDRKRHRR